MSTLPLLLTRLRARLKGDFQEEDHPRDEGGQFTSSGSDGGKEPSHLERLRAARQAHETARQAHEAARQEHQEARQAAYNGERDLAHAAYGRYSSAAEQAYELHMHMESEGTDEADGEAAAAYLRIENAAMALNDLVDISEGTVSERREQLEELRDGSKDMLSASDALDEQKDQAREMRQLAKEALAGLRDYSKHRLAMRDIRSGESKAVLPVLLKRFQGRLKAADAAGHEHKPEGPGGGQFTGHGGGGGGEGKPAGKKPRQVQRGPDTTYEGVPKDRANKLTAEESREAIAYAEGMTTLVGSNGPNKRLPDAARPELDEYEQGALQKYSYLNDRILNRWLRKGECCAGSPYNETFFKELHSLMQSAFDKAPVLDKPIRVLRGMPMRDEAQLNAFIDQMRQAGESGQPVTFNGYTSTAKPGGLLYKLGLVPGIPAAFRGKVSLTINAIHGLDVKPYSQLPAEEEFLLNHASQFKVKSMVQKKDGWHIELDQLPPAKSSKKWLGRYKQAEGEQEDGKEGAALAAFYKKHPEAVGKWLDTDASFIDFGGRKDKAALPQLLKRFQARLKDTAHADDDPDEAAVLMADVLYGVYGRNALRLLARSEKTWREDFHPRGADGKFIPKGSGEAGKAAHEAIRSALHGEPSPRGAEHLLGHLAILSVKQLKELHGRHGGKAPPRLRAQLVAAISQRLHHDAPSQPEKPAEKPAEGQFSHEFKKWFDGSKVVDQKGDPKEVAHMDAIPDAQGKPIVVYHGGRDFEHFDKSKIAHNGHWGAGFYFTENGKEAEEYLAQVHRAGDKGKIHEVYLRINKPFNTRTDGVPLSSLPEAVVRRMTGGTPTPEELAYRASYDELRQVMKTDDINAHLQKLGYDGLATKGAKGNWWVAFEPEQIKHTHEAKAAAKAALPQLLKRLQDRLGE